MSDIKATYEINGQRYWLEGHLGCQLKSRESNKLELGYVRHIAGELMYVWSCRRHGIGYEIAWSLTHSDGDIFSEKKKIDRFIQKIKGCDDPAPTGQKHES